MKMTAEILDSNNVLSKKDGKAYTIVLARVSDRVGKFFSPMPLDKFIGKTIDVEMDLTVGQNMNFGTKFTPLVK